jgi:hypothetical protein
MRISAADWAAKKKAAASGVSAAAAFFTSKINGNLTAHAAHAAHAAQCNPPISCYLLGINNNFLAIKQANHRIHSAIL